MMEARVTILSLLIWMISSSVLNANINEDKNALVEAAANMEEANMNRVQQYFKLLSNPDISDNLIELYGSKCYSYITRINNEPLKIEWYEKLGKYYLNQPSFIHKSIPLFNSIATYNMIYFQPQEIGKSYAYIAEAFISNYDLLNAKVYYEKALNYLDQEMIKDDVADIYSYYIPILVRFDLKEKAFTLSNQLLKFYEDKNDEVNELKVNLIISDIYRSYDKDDKAIKFLESLVQKYDQTSSIDPKNQDQVNNFFELNFKLAYLHRSKGDFKTAIDYYNTCFNIVDEFNAAQLLAKAHNGIGKTYLLQENFKMAIEHFENALEIQKDDKTMSVQNAILHGNLARSYASLGVEDKSLYFLNKALTDADHGSCLFLQKNSRQNAYKAHKSLGNHEEALQYFIEYKELDEKIKTVAQPNKLSKLEKKYQMMKDEKQNELMLKDQKIAFLKKDKSIIYYSFLITLLVALSTIITIVFFKSRKFKNLADRLKVRNQVIRKQNREIAIALKKEKKLIKDLQEINNIMHTFFLIISHELRGPFNVILGFSDLLLSTLDTLDKEEIKTYAEGIKTSAQKNYNFTEELLSWAELNQQGMHLEKTTNDFKGIVDKILYLHKDILDKKNIKIKLGIEDALQGKVDGNIVKTVLSNLITNAIKFSEEGGEIEINGKKEKDMICLEVNDNGVGMTEAQRAKIMTKGSKVKSKNGTAGESGCGIGLKFCKELLSYHKGHLTVKSIMGKGTSFSVFLNTA